MRRGGVLSCRPAVRGAEAAAAGGGAPSQQQQQEEEENNDDDDERARRTRGARDRVREGKQFAGGRVTAALRRPH